MSLCVRVIPCLDVKSNRVVKGVNFAGLADAGDPVDCAVAYNDAGADELVLLDIAASLEKRATWLHTINAIAERVFIPFMVGGGISSIQDIYNLLNNGADKISLNSAAISNPDLITQSAKQFGSQCTTVAIDIKAHPEKPHRWQVYSHGGTRNTKKDALDWARQVVDLGAGEILLTSMDTDGVKQGYDIAITQKIATTLSVPIIASGGAGMLEHFSQGVQQGKADALLAASVLHFGTFTIKQIKAHLRAQNIAVRL